MLRNSRLLALIAADINYLLVCISRARINKRKIMYQTGNLLRTLLAILCNPRLAAAQKNTNQVQCVFLLP